MILDAIDAVDWSALPNPTPWPGDEPARVADALRRLTVSTTANETGSAAAALEGSGFTCGHAAMVFPAAYPATTILLDLVEHGRRPRIKAVALSLVFDALCFSPLAGHNRVDTPYGTDVPLCCAIARQIRSRAGVLLAYGIHGKHLLAQAALHWRLAVEEAESQPDGSTTALATLEGVPFATPAEAEVHTAASGDTGAILRVESLTADASGAACVQLADVRGVLPSGAVLYDAECGRREH
ncbi:hypothetical protein [Actinacidiphila glaucinigra]|uniref:hypothetical protein n=1 Tax=Actinacidiphila glaucinigra TaxID=235986 RepID=UPI003671E230